MDARLLYLLETQTVVNPPVARVHVTTPQLISTTLSPTWNATDYAINNATAATTGITVPIQGYYLVQACATFSASSSSTYSSPVAGSFGRIDILVGGVNYSAGSAIAQSVSGSAYRSVANDIVYAAQNTVITASVSGSSTGSIYLWSGTSDAASSYLSVTYVCS